MFFSIKKSPETFTLEQLNSKIAEVTAYTTEQQDTIKGYCKTLGKEDLFDSLPKTSMKDAFDGIIKAVVEYAAVIKADFKLSNPSAGSFQQPEEEPKVVFEKPKTAIQAIESCKVECKTYADALEQAKKLYPELFK